MRTAWTTLCALATLAAGTSAVSAQEDPATQQTPPDVVETPQPKRLEPPHSTELVFEREIFDYPQFTRRNPFVALVATQSGPRFEQIRLRGIIYMDPPGESVALLGIGTSGEQGGNGAQAETPGDQSRRVHAGESWGNVRVLEIRRAEILVQVEEFGLTEQRTMRLPTRGQGD